MSSPGKAPRIVIYSHDTYGLGHLTRSSRLARAAAEALPQASILLLTGSPVAHFFSFPDGVDYVKLPSVVKTGSDTYSSRDLQISSQEIRELRERIIRETVLSFAPDLLLVDNVPAGMKGELLPTLAELDRRPGSPLVHLNLRDILDEPAVIDRAWAKQGVRELLAECYSAINIFGRPEIYDARRLYGLPADKTDYLGYIRPFAEECGGVTPYPGGGTSPFRILVTAGGGGDGFELLSRIGSMQAELGGSSLFEIVMITGPLMESARRRELAARFADVEGLELVTYVRGLPAWMTECDAVVAMGGYNTLCEILSYSRRALIVPRVAPRREQLIRASAFSRLGLVDMLSPTDLDSRRMREALENLMQRDARQEGRHDEIFQGIPEFQNRLRALFPERRNADEAQTGIPDPRIGEAERAIPERNASDPIPLSGREVESAASSEAPKHKRRWASGGDPLLWLLLFLLAAVSPAGADLDPRPESLRLDFGYGHDDNLLNASDAELLAFETDDPGAFFVVDRMRDHFVGVSAEANWRMGRVFGKKMKLRLRYERIHYLNSAIKGENGYALKLQSRLSEARRISFSAGYRPQVYGRHRLDKDALPGAAQFRAELHRRWDLALGLEQRLSERLALDGEIASSWRSYAEAFRERDRQRTALAGGLVFTPASCLDLSIAAEYRINRSSNEPDLGKDLSYREWRLATGILLRRASDLSRMGGEFHVVRRLYSSEITDDWNHNGRRDLIGGILLHVERTLNPDLVCRFEYEHNRRSAELDSGQAIDYDEEGSFSENIMRCELTWRWQR